MELVDSAELVDVQLSNLFNISKQLLDHPVTTFHACFSSFQVCAGEGAMNQVMEYINLGVMENESIATYRPLRKVNNWIDIELDMDGQGSMTEVLFETNLIILTEASHEWKRHSELPEMNLKEQLEYFGTVTHVKSPAEFYVQLEQVTSPKSEPLSANESEGLSLTNQEKARALIFETLPSHELTAIPNYTPFPFELVCAKVDNRWLRARVTQICWWSSENGPDAEVEVFCVDHGYSATVKGSDTRPITDEFLFHQGTGGEENCNEPIAAQAIKVSLPGAPEQKSSFTDEALDLFCSEVFRQRVKLKLNKPRAVHSPYPNECLVWKLCNAGSNNDSSDCIEEDLLQMCLSKGILNMISLPEIPATAIKVEDLERDILAGPSRGMTCETMASSSLDIDVTPTKKETEKDESDLIASSYDVMSSAVPIEDGQQELPRDLRKGSKPLHQFDEDSSTQFSSDYLDAHLNGISEKYVEALQEEVVQLKDRVDQLENEMEEMRKFKISVTKQLTKFRNAFG